MPLSCLPVSFYAQILSGEMTIREWAHICSKIGLDGIDLSILLISHHTSRYIEGLRKDIESAGMSTIIITTYSDFTQPNSLQRERELEYAKHDIAIASQLGAKYLRITAGQAHQQTSRADGIRWVVENFNKLVPVSEKYGIELLFENHSKPSAWDYVDFSFPTDIFLEIVEGIRDTPIGINFDTCNPIYYGDDAIAILEKVIDKVFTVHIADTAEKGKMLPTIIGHGVVPLRDIVSFLNSNNFAGWYSIEETSNMGIPGVEEAVWFVKTILKVD